jgi:hypothetical protein
MGSEIRARGEVNDFGSGVREAGKGLWWGWWDGITGLVTEPIAGGKKEVCLLILSMLLNLLMDTFRVQWELSKGWGGVVSGPVLSRCPIPGLIVVIRRKCDRTSSSW